MFKFNVTFFMFKQKGSVLSIPTCVKERLTAMLCPCVCVFLGNLFTHRDRAFSRKDMQPRSKLWAPSMFLLWLTIRCFYFLGLYHSCMPRQSSPQWHLPTNMLFLSSLSKLLCIFSLGFVLFSWQTHKKLTSWHSYIHIILSRCFCTTLFSFIYVYIFLLSHLTVTYESLKLRRGTSRYTFEE